VSFRVEVSEDKGKTWETLKTENPPPEVRRHREVFEEDPARVVDSMTLEVGTEQEVQLHDIFYARGTVGLRATAHGKTGTGKYRIISRDKVVGFGPGAGLVTYRFALAPPEPPVVNVCDGQPITVPAKSLADDILCDAYQQRKTIDLKVYGNDAQARMITAVITARTSDFSFHRTPPDYTATVEYQWRPA